MKKSFIVLLLLLGSCNNLPDECPELLFEQNEKITSTLDGKLFTGRCTTYENGKQRSIQQYINGVDYGKWTFYFPDGSIQTTGKFNKNGKRIGKWLYYYENGNLKQISNYSSNGERSNKWTYYNEEGEITDEINY